MWNDEATDVYDDSLVEIDPVIDINRVQLRKAFDIWKLLWTMEEIVMYG